MCVYRFGSIILPSSSGSRPRRRLWSTIFRNVGKFGFNDPAPSAKPVWKQEITLFLVAVAWLRQRVLCYAGQWQCYSRQLYDVLVSGSATADSVMMCWSVAVLQQTVIWCAGQWQCYSRQLYDVLVSGSATEDSVMMCWSVAVLQQTVLWCAGQWQC